MVPYIQVLMQVLLKATVPCYNDFCCQQCDRTAINVKKWLTCLCAELCTRMIWSPHLNLSVPQGGHTEAQLAEALRYKPEGYGFDS